jgi:hypothetical protein
MKNFMPNLSENSSAPFTSPRSAHQHLSAFNPRCKFASFIFIGLKPWYEQGTLMVEKGWREEEERERTLVHQNKLMLSFIEEHNEKLPERL